MVCKCYVLGEVYFIVILFNIVVILYKNRWLLREWEWDGKDYLELLMLN